MGSNGIKALDRSDGINSVPVRWGRKDERESLLAN